MTSNLRQHTTIRDLVVPHDPVDAGLENGLAAGIAINPNPLLACETGPHAGKNKFYSGATVRLAVVRSRGIRRSWDCKRASYALDRELEEHQHTRKAGHKRGQTPGMLYIAPAQLGE
jgi:hypothetical protein